MGTEFQEDRQEGGRTDRRVDMTKLLAAFRNFANTPKPSRSWSGVRGGSAIDPPGEIHLFMSHLATARQCAGSLSYLDLDLYLAAVGTSLSRPTQQLSANHDVVD